MKMGKNREGYPDPTAREAFNNMRRKDRLQEIERLNAISSIVKISKQMAELAGFEIVGRVTFRDKHTGREYR